MSFILASTVLLTILYLKKWYWTKLNETTRKQVGHGEMSNKKILLHSHQLPRCQTLEKLFSFCTLNLYCQGL